MPLYEGSCGCYNWSEAKQYGVTAAILLNWFKNSYRHYKNKGELVDDMFWHDQKDIADEIAFGIKMLYNAIEVLEEAGIIRKKIGYRPGTTKKTTWWGFAEGQVRLEVSESAQTAVSIESAQTAVSIYNETKKEDSLGEGEDIIPKADVTKPFIEITVYDSDDSCKTITVTHQVAPKDWNKAVNKWRKDPTERVMMPFKDTGETEQMTYRRIKKYNLRPKSTNGMGYDRSAGSQFKV